MGHVRVSIKLANPSKRDEPRTIENALVDTGATWTSLPRSLARSLELDSLGKISVRTASGPVEMDQSYVYLEIGEKHMVSPVLIADSLDVVLIGVTTLEALGLAVDPGTGQLRESEVYLLAGL